MANLFLGLGALFLLIGIALKWGLLDWFGRLPGDIRYEGEHFAFFAPITSMLLISILLSLILWLFNR
ncbi:DUF2905 family protein [Nitratifractor sp.]